MRSQVRQDFHDMIDEVKAIAKEVGTAVSSDPQPGGISMRDSRSEDSRPKRRRRRRRRDGRLEPAPPPVPSVPPVPPAAQAPPMAPEPTLSAPRTPAEELQKLAEQDESLLDPEERAYLEARRTAEAKVGLYREAVKIGIPVLVLAVIPFMQWAAVLLLLFGSIKLGRKYYSVMVEPGLRRRIMHEEVGKQVRQGVRRERQQLEGEHARTLEQLSASIAHEIRNPITAAKSLVQQMEEEPTAGDNVEYARVALGELERVEKSISHLLKYAREEEIRKQPISMSDVLDSAIETFRDRAERTSCSIERQFDNAGRMTGDPEKLRRVFINLVGNAIDALAEASTIEPCVEVAMGENLAGTEVWVRVRDNGPGIDAETRERIFNPFYTSKSSGTGLGLAITRKLVDAHGGSIELESGDGAGTEFTLTFPKNGGAAS